MTKFDGLTTCPLVTIFFKVASCEKVPSDADSRIKPKLLIHLKSNISVRFLAHLHGFGELSVCQHFVKAPSAHWPSVRINRIE